MKPFDQDITDICVTYDILETRNITCRTTDVTQRKYDRLVLYVRSR